jgi:hypothetical protein
LKITLAQKKKISKKEKTSQLEKLSKKIVKARRKKKLIMG